ncbi:hypothetical protein [Kitasatospora sp. NPDC088134]|uniref:hypothetical protein n=1 Tax=Kitasatospora sp. NPDC088134 TaxID=3364071 RepID=UPI00380DC725
MLEQYRLAVLAALTAARLEPLHEAQEHLYLPFATRAPDSKRWHARGVELDWTDNRQPKNGRRWHYGPLDIWLGAGWELYEPLPLPPFAHPEDIAAVVHHVLLTGDRYIAPRTSEWEHAHALTVLLELVEAAQKDAGRPPSSI